MSPYIEEHSDETATTLSGLDAELTLMALTFHPLVSLGGYLVGARKSAR